MLAGFYTEEDFVHTGHIGITQFTVQMFAVFKVCCVDSCISFSAHISDFSEMLMLLDAFKLCMVKSVLINNTCARKNGVRKIAIRSLSKRTIEKSDMHQRNPFGFGTFSTYMNILDWLCFHGNTRFICHFHQTL